MPTERICMSMILLEPAYKILHTAVKFKRRTISVTRLFRQFERDLLSCAALVQRIYNADSVEENQPGLLINDGRIHAWNGLQIGQPGEFLGPPPRNDRLRH